MHEHGIEEGADLFDVLIDIAQDAVFDTLYLIPFLLITYLFMEWFEHRTGERTQQMVRNAGKAGPVIGALLGVIPQCGFSAATATLYAARVVTLGTLFAVFLSTSDEMLPIFIAEQVPVDVLLKILGLKVLIGMIAGFAVDAVMRFMHKDRDKIRIHELCERDHCDCNAGCETCEHNPELVYEHFECDDSCAHEHAHHDHSHDSGWGGILKSAVKHTLQVTVFVFLVSLTLNAVLAFVGEEALADFLGSNGVLAVAGASIIGLIPNCAASVAIAQLYLEGVLSFGAMMAGLLSAAGVGMLVLLRTNRNARQNLCIIVALVGISFVCGLFFDVIGFAV